MPTNSSTSLKTIVDFSRRKGFVYPSSEIYGGYAATYDFGPLGKLLKDNLVQAWRNFMVNYRTDTVEIEGAIFLHPKVWEASGHIGGFSDLLVEDLVTKKRYRADHLVEEAGIVWPLSTNSESNRNPVGQIKNLVLDFGGVVFEAEYMTVNKFLASRYNLMEGRDYQGKELWEATAQQNMEDNGKLKNLGFWKIYVEKLGLETKVADELYDFLLKEWGKQVYAQTVKAIEKYKAKGLKIYYLTNTSTDVFSTREKAEAFALFDGGVNDLEQPISKPNPEIYQFLLEKYDLQARECIFVDDLEKNIPPAQSLGFQTIHFQENTDLEAEIEKILQKSETSNFQAETKSPTNVENQQVLTDAGSLTSEEIDQIIEHYKLKSPDGNPLSKAKKFNLLVKTHLGPIEDESTLAYLKGEACANTYVDWKQVLETTRRKLPFGIAQLGKAFRNEITVKQFMFRTREFEQIDMEFFVKPPEYVKKDESGQKLEKDHFDWFAYWKDERYKFYTEFLGYSSENLKWHQHSPEELVFYAAEAWDIYYNFGEIGFKEMEGVHNRTDYDTRQHQKFSGTDLTYFDPENNQRYLPYVVEMSLGVNRLFLATLFEFYREEIVPSPENEKNQEIIKQLEEILAQTEA